MKYLSRYKILYSCINILCIYVRNLKYTSHICIIKLTVCFKVGRSYHSLTAVDGSLVAAGGWDGSTRFSSVEILGETGWSTASWSLKAPVFGHCAVSYQGELVILGGYDGSRRAFRRIYENSFSYV